MATDERNTRTGKPATAQRDGVVTSRRWDRSNASVLNRTLGSGRHDVTCAIAGSRGYLGEKEMTSDSPTVNLFPVYALWQPEILFALLQERPEYANISHRKMPTMAEHLAFFESRPYEAWYFIGLEGGEIVGAIYLSKSDEIGIGVFEKHQGNGYGPAAIRALMALHPRPRYLANVAPRNERSAAMFYSLGFREIQRTFEVRPEDAADIADAEAALAEYERDGGVTLDELKTELAISNK